jgi:hypothetical protein
VAGHQSGEKRPLGSKASFAYPSDYPSRFVTFHRWVFRIKKALRWARVQRPLTRLLGFQYRAAPDLIEIDLTYLCNLRCNNCNRSSAQAPDAVHIDLPVITRFVDDSLDTGRNWARIRLLGGEPSLHPQFRAIVDELLRYKAVYPNTSIQVVTNGYGPKVRKAIATLPNTIYIENSSKEGNVQPAFGAFNMAPQDNIAYSGADYRNGCSIASTCGMGLTPQGYYPCAIAGGIDRVLGLRRGRSTLPAVDDEMRDLMDHACRLCGRFSDGHFVPPRLRPPLMTQQTSPSWQRIYEHWHDSKDRTKNRVAE